MPHFAVLVSTYLIIFTSAWLKLAISLQASSGGACRSLAALISLPRFSASSRRGTKPFMQASPEPPEGAAAAVGGGPKPPPPPLPPATGAAPFTGNDGLGGGAPMEAAGAAPLTGGNAGSFLTVWLGSGAGKAPCASASPP